jgi:hypothetical protein
MNTDWNPSKNEANIAKHGIDFADFDGFDDEPTIVEDTRHDYGEVRFIAFGRIDGIGYSVVYTMRGETMWIISFRRARDKEMRRYE